MQSLSTWLSCVFQASRAAVHGSIGSCIWRGRVDGRMTKGRDSKVGQRNDGRRDVAISNAQLELVVYSIA